MLEAHTITGPGDMLCRVVARSNTDLQRVIDVIVDVEGVERASSVISLATQVPYRTLPLVRATAEQAKTARGERTARTGRTAPGKQNGPHQKRPAT